MVWKTPNIVEKSYDLAKAMHVKSAEMRNDAYCPGRSTQRTLSKLCSWKIDPETGLLGVDFENAFGLCCRECANTLAGVTLVADEIEYVVRVNGVESAVQCSRAGTGAGRPTGGPAFNITFEHILDGIPSDMVKRGDMSPFADDSQMKTALVLEYIRDILIKFESGSDVGLSPHLGGPKGPCLLIREIDRALAERIAEGVRDIAELKISTEIIFLGVNVYIDCEHGVSVTSLTSKSKQMLAFFSTQLVRALKLLTSCSKSNSPPDNEMLKSASRSISAFIESRIQYNIAFCDTDSIDYYFNVHKRVVCAILGHSAHFFGFKWRTSTRKYVSDLYDYLDTICTPTYIRLCKLAGRPTMLDLARRATRVVQNQYIEERTHDDVVTTLRPRKPKFISKIEAFNEAYDAQYSKIPNPRENEFYNLVAESPTVRHRSAAIRMSTDTLLRSHLASRGYEIDTNCNTCKSEPETVRHILQHISIDKNFVPLSLNFKRKIERLCRLETEQLAAPNKRVRLNIEPPMTNFFMQALPDFDMRGPRTMKTRKHPARASAKNYKKRKK